MPLLNLKQRIALAVAGAVVLAVQWYQFLENGVEGVSWIVALVVGVALLLPVLGVGGKTQARPNATPPQADAASSAAGVPTKTTDLLEAIRYRASFLWEQLPQWVGVPDIPALKQINELMTEHWLTYCQSYMFALMAASEARKDRFFLGSEREKALTIGVGQMILDSTRDLARRQNFPELFHREKALKAAARDLSEARVAMRSFMEAIATRQADPDAPLIDYFASKVGVPPAVREGFDRHIRDFTKDTLRAFSQLNGQGHR
jgi:hypothetical protein